MLRAACHEVQFWLILFDYLSLCGTVPQTKIIKQNESNQSFINIVGAQDTEDGAHDEGEYGSDEPLREQVGLSFHFRHIFCSFLLCCSISAIFMAYAIGWEHYAMIVVCLSIWPVPDHKSRIEGCSKLKIGRREARDADDPVTPFRVKRSKVRLINTEMENVRYLWMGKPTNFRLGLQL